MVKAATFDDLIAEGEAVPVEGWDFSWFDGRATEQRPSWGYTQMLPPRMEGVGAVLDIQTGGGEVFAEVLAKLAHPPRVLAATESWSPNLEIANRNLQSFGVSVMDVAEDADLPFPDGSFDLVVSRHPTVTVWDEIARVLTPDGTYLSQQIAAGSNRELIDFMMGPQPVSDRHNWERAVVNTEAAGLEVVDLRPEALRTVFYDIGAVVYYLRKVIWTVPGFTVEGYRDRLAELHDRIVSEGQFAAHAQRFLIEARKPG
jgi:SAM-dependent methyltransferase